MATRSGNLAITTGEETLHHHMEHQRSKLIDIIDPGFGLLNTLLQKRVLSDSEVERIKAKTSRHEKNELLLDSIAKNKKQVGFVAALESSQTHVANWIVANGNNSGEFGLDWPLTDTETETLNMNQTTLVETLDTGDLLNRLYSERVISMRQKQFIESNRTDHDKNEALLDIVRRTSRKGYSTVIQCLRDSNQGHIAGIFKNGGAIIPVHASLQGDNLNETEIVDKMTDFLRRNTTSMEQAHRVIDELRLNIIAVKRGESIVLFIGCSQENDLDHLCKVVDNMEMKALLERLFSLFLHKLEIKVDYVEIFEPDLKKAQQTLVTLERIKFESVERNKFASFEPGRTDARGWFEDWCTIS